MLPRDFSKFDSILCCKVVAEVGGTALAGVLIDNELKGRGCGRGGEVNKLSAALSRSALEPVKESSSPNFICLIGGHFKCNKIYVLKSLNQGKLKTRENNEKYLSCQNRNFTE